MAKLLARSRHQALDTQLSSVSAWWPFATMLFNSFSFVSWPEICKVLALSEMRPGFYPFSPPLVQAYHENFIEILIKFAFNICQMQRIRFGRNVQRKLPRLKTEQARQTHIYYYIYTQRRRKWKRDGEGEADGAWARRETEQIIEQ